MSSFQYVLIICFLGCGDKKEINPQDPPNNFTVTTLGDSFNGSGGVAVDTAGNIFVADFGDQLNNANGKIVTKISPQGDASQFASGLRGASGNAFDSKGNLFQSNIASSTISKIAPDGTVSIFSSQNLQGPVGIAIDNNDNLFVCNCGGNSITKITQDGQSEIFVSSSLLSCPNGMAIDKDGNLYPVNFNNGDVLKISPGGDIQNLVNLPGASNAHITYANDRLYVVGRNAAKIFEVTLTGEFKAIAGTDTRGNNDGPAMEATFFTPNGIDASPDESKLYVTSKLQGQGTQLNPILLRIIHLNE